VYWVKIRQPAMPSDVRDDDDIASMNEEESIWRVIDKHTKKNFLFSFHFSFLSINFVAYLTVMQLKTLFDGLGNSYYVKPMNKG
jgi:hypothetical protein